MCRERAAALALRAWRASAPDGYTFVIGQLTRVCPQQRCLQCVVRSAGGFRARRAADHSAAMVDRAQRTPGQRSEGVDRLAEGQSRQRLAGHHRRWQPLARLRRALPEPNGDASIIRPLSRRRSCLARSRGRADRSLDAGGVEHAAVGPRRPIKALAVLDKARWASAPDVPTADEAGIPGLHMPFWHGLLGAQGSAERGDRQAQRRRR